jgi:hypothetical protein
MSEDEELAHEDARDQRARAVAAEARADELAAKVRSLEAENAALRETLEHADLEIRHLRQDLDNANGDFVTAMGWKSSHDHSD